MREYDVVIVHRIDRDIPIGHRLLIPYQLYLTIERFAILQADIISNTSAISCQL